MEMSLARVRHACAPLRSRLGRSPLSACCRTPRVRHAKALVRGGVLRALSVPEPRASHRSFRAVSGPVAAPHDHPNRGHRHPGRRRSSARSTSCRSRYRSWVAQPGPSTTTVHTPSRTERTDGVRGERRADDRRPRARRASSTRPGGGSPSSRPDRRERVAQRHRLVARRHRPRAHDGSPLDHAARVRPRSVRCATTSGGSAPAVVSRVWPGGQVAHERGRRAARRAR